MLEIRKEILCEKERVVVKQTTPHSGFKLIKNGKTVLSVELNPKSQITRKPLHFFAAKGLSVIGTKMSEMRKWKIKKIFLSAGDLFLDTQIGRCKVVFF